MAKIKATSIKEIIPSVIDHIQLYKHYQSSRLQEVWKSIMQKEGLERVQPVREQDGVVEVHVDSAAKLFVVNLKKQQILKQLQKERPEITDIIFKVGKVL